MYLELKNRLDFFLRNKFRFSRKNFIEKNKDLIERNKLENLYTKDILTKYFTKKNKDSLRILDIGCKNWFYAKGEYAFFHEFSNNFQMDGVELDAFRLYSNFYSRFETAKYYTKELKNVKYIADNLLNIHNKYDYIIWFLPFITPEPLKYWGLPIRYFCPEKLLEHAYSLLKEESEMLIINQGDEEARIQEAMLKKLKIPYKALGEVKSKYFKYKNKRFGFIIKK